MNTIINTIKTITAFLLLIAVPQLAESAVSSEIQTCIQSIQEKWSMNTSQTWTGSTRHETNCSLFIESQGNTLNLSAVGEPLNIGFSLGNSDASVTQTLQSCKVDKEKIHLVFEEKKDGTFEKRDQVQLTLLKRQGKRMSMILSKRERRILQPALHSSLICHLN